ncbi:MAG: hypothetical protein QOG64_2904 [Acidimicrobiaceae bacterium]|jgi:Rrf2 family protein|nr:hypothetical protein [Acidimicrobiaceae bacterium]
MQVSAKADYALRALSELAAAGGGPLKGGQLASSQSIPPKFLENILIELRHAGIVHSQRGAEGGYRLARPADRINLAEILRAVDGPLANVRGLRPEEVVYDGSASHLVEVWIAVRASLRSVLETITLQGLVDGELPKGVVTLTDDPESWKPH